MSKHKYPIFITALIFLLIVAGCWIFIQKQYIKSAKQATKEAVTEKEKLLQKTTSPTSPPRIPAIQIAPGDHDTTLADLGTPPDWQTLDLWQETITHDDFTRLLTKVYTVDDTWKRYITIYPNYAIIRTNTRKPNAYYQLNFSKEFNDSSPDRSWRTVDELPPTRKDKPLLGIRIVIDPGHIGGKFAKLEERWFQIGTSKPVMEGELTLETAKIIKRKLRKLGAHVFLTRSTNEPVNPNRPEFYLAAALAQARSVGKINESTINRYKNKFFYLTGEIRARARRINYAYNPDLVLCLHYNAESWADPHNPSLTTRNHYHLIVHGALTSSEFAHDDERFEMLTKILQHNFEEEREISIEISKTMAKETGLPAYEYEKNSKRARKISGAPGIWARNLLANRIYHCPVIFLEPYVMNNKEVFDRIQLGNYSGTQKINGVERKSIQEEYADAVVDGLKNYYLKRRVIYND